ncbi:Fer4_NifH domain containing protein [uncultured Caudovirales phage]|uniref:Fer4_NifH domain containing protein n=1 Tax=uncultured Caudovirales phage TaxID=2100421 RepID=A0A6J5KMK8_9CAUD|nr:Fer4_NifH domain containing protein [uncultured Caudovirales phage]
MKIINLFGGPGVGKSTTAAGLFYEMKKRHLNVELVTEYAKDAVWENRSNLLDDQIYIFAKQQRRISRLMDHGIEWVITDSPISLGLVYLRDGTLSSHFNELVMEVFNRFENHNFLLQRKWAYNPVGRMQTETQAREFDDRVLALLNRYNVPCSTVTGGEQAVAEILENLWSTGDATPI